MLGNKIGGETGRVTGRRIIKGDDYRFVKMEITFETQATILGHQGMQMGTYTIFERVPGQLYGEGQGIFMTADGDGAIWNGHGIGRMTGDGVGAAFAASVAFQGSGKLTDLNGMLVLVEHTTDAEGNAKSTLYEWKA